MSSANLTMMGLYNVVPDLFDDLTFPAGISKDIAVDEILLRSGEFEVLYSDITFLKSAIDHWGKKHYRTFEEWVRALSINFDPLYNYDRFEEYTDEKVSQGSQSRTGSETNSNVMQSADHRNETESENRAEGENSSNVGNDFKTSANDTGTTGHDLTTGNSISGTGSDTSTLGETERQVSAYDSANYQPREKETNSNGTTGLGDGYAANTNETEKSESTSGSSSESGSHDLNESRNSFAESSNDRNMDGTSQTSGQSDTRSQEAASDNRAEQAKHTAHLYGNIGVTTSTQMLEDFLRVERFTIYEEIADMFVSEFCIMVY